MTITSFLHRFIAILRIIFMLCFTFISMSFAQEVTDAARIETIRAILQQVDSSLERKTLSDGELTEIRAKVEPLVEELQVYSLKQSTKLEAMKTRLEQLVPKEATKNEVKPTEIVPEVETPQSSVAIPDVNKERIAQEKAAQDKQIKDLDNSLRIARYETEHGQQILGAISERRRSLFTQALLDRNQSIISARLWLGIARDMPTEMKLLLKFFGDWFNDAVQNLDFLHVGALIAFVAVLFLAVPRLLKLIAHFEGQTKDEKPKKRLRQAITALRVIVGATILPAIICLAVFLVSQFLGLVNNKTSHVVRVVLLGVVFLFFVRAMCRAVIPSDLPNWRVFGGSDKLAQKLTWLSSSVALTLVLGKICETLFHVIVAPLMILIAIKGVTAVIIAALIIRALLSFTEQEKQSEDTPEPDLNKQDHANWVRIVGWFFCAAILSSASTGYIALASFLAVQIVWVATVIVFLALVLIIIDELIGKGMSSEGLLGQRVRNSVGLKSGSIDQISILSSGLLRIVALLIALFLVLAPWGVDSGDLTGYLKSAFFGFSVAGVTISLSTTATALIIFVIGLTLTRAIQRWLDTKYLPFTGLDIGLRNSIKTIFGYIGVFIASALAFSAAGLSLDKLTIVAGALSVGIGFGLQSIVNNFVSGLILLWERPLRVGDWIAVGGEEGIVKKINVRATEIETFDKASLIVPNSEFISGRVKNWVHSTRYARIIIPISVKNTTDPKKMDRLLTEVALAHREILSQPAPKVFFIKITDSSLDFELRCFADVDVMGATKSELLFAIYERLQTDGIDMPLSTRTIEIADFERLGSVIASSIPKL